MKRRIAVGLLAIALGSGALAVAGPAVAQDAKGGQKVTTPSGLVIEDLKIGTGPEAKPGDTVLVDYVGTLENGTKFDSSIDRHEPFSFKLGAGSVIKGWDEGVKGMRTLGRRRLIIPPQLAYGARGAGSDIPPNATILFDIQLLQIR